MFAELKYKLLLFFLVLVGMGCGGEDLQIVEGPFVEGSTSDEVAVVWRTKKPGDSKVEYGRTSSFGEQVENSDAVTDHRIVLTRLRSGRTYYYRVSSGGSEAEGTFVAGLSFARGPYTQYVTASEATVMWGTAPLVSARVDAKAASGEPVSAEGDGRVRLIGLQAGMVYRYRVLAQGVSSPEGTFRTSGSSDDAVTFILYGDSRENPSLHARLAVRMASHDPDLVVHSGDFVENGQNEAEWNPLFFEPVRPLALKAPVYPTLGNHEKDGAPYYAAFEVPPNGSSTRPEAWYSFDYGPTHFIVLDSNPQSGDLDPGTEQRKWLEEDLAGSNARWKFLILHHPLYSSGRHKSNVLLREILMPLCERFGVDMVLTGHDHCYERTWPLRGDNRSDDGVVQVVSGGGGASLYTVGRSAWTAVSESVSHYCVLKVTNSHLDMEVYDVEGRQVDALRLLNDEGSLEEMVAALSRKENLAKAIRELGLTGRMKAIEAIVPFASNEDAEIRNATAEALARIGAPSGLGALTNLTRDTNAETRHWAARGVSTIGGSEAAVVLRGLLANSDIEMRRLAANGLRWSPIRQAVPDLIQTAKDSAPGVRLASVQALLQIQNTPLEEVLDTALRDVDARVRSAALEGVIARKAEQKVAGGLIEMLSKTTGEILLDVLNALGKSNSDRAVEPIIAYLKHKEKSVQRTAAIALGHLKRRAAVGALIDAMEDQDQNTRRFSWLALRSITNKSFPNRAEDWRTWFESENQK